MKFKFAVSCYVPVETQFFDYINRVPVSVLVWGMRSKREL